MKNDSCSGKRESNAGDPAERGQHETFREHLPDLTRGRRPECGANRSLQFAVCRADEHKVGYVGTGNRQDQRGNPHQKVQAGLVFVTQHLNSCAAGREMQSLSRDQGRFTGL